MGAMTMDHEAAHLPPRILVVDDMAEIRLLARMALERRGFDVTEAGDGETALSLMRAGTVDLVVLDVNLPRMSGLAVLTRIRKGVPVPVILLTALDDEADRVLGLDLGADDYVVKPFSPVELGARVASVLRRSGAGATALHAGATALHAGGHDPPASPAPPAEDRAAVRTIVVRLSERQVLVAGASVDLTPKEFDLLVCLASAPRRVFSRAELLEHVWESALDWQDPSTVTEHVRRLRRKLEADPENPCWIQTVRGVGYRFDPDGRASPVVNTQP